MSPSGRIPKITFRQAIRRAAGLNSLPVDSISEISVLDPYFYVGAGG